MHPKPSPLLQMGTDSPTISFHFGEWLLRFPWSATRKGQVPSRPPSWASASDEPDESEAAASLRGRAPRAAGLWVQGRVGVGHLQRSARDDFTGHRPMSARPSPQGPRVWGDPVTPKLSQVSL